LKKGAENMKKCLVLSAVLWLLVLLAAPASADLNNYVVGKLGFYTPNSSDLSGYDTGFSGEFAFGHYFNPFVALELGAGYFQTSGNVIVVTNHNTFLANEDIGVTPLTLSLRLIQPLSRTTEIYAIGGIGAYFVYSDINAFGLSDDTTAFGAHLGAGINFNLNRNIFLGGEFKYVWVNPSLYGVDVSLDGFRVNVNIGFRF
jgi:opacity protein-like surface antigen